MLDKELGISVGVYNGLFTLAGVFVGALFPLINNIITLRQNRSLEYMKLSHTQRLDAYKQLFSYSRQLMQIVWPDNEFVYDDFIRSCINDLQSIIPNYPYYSYKVIQDLAKIELLFDITNINVDWKVPPNEQIEKELPAVASHLYNSILEDFKKWNK